jgi:hypothetical protein
MKRAFRVATVFTGAAAFATVMTPAAQAARVVPGHEFVPDVTARLCSPLTTGSQNLVELAYVKGHGPECFTGNGQTAIEGAPFNRYCADSKSGEMYIRSVGWLPFTEGTHNLYGQVVSSIIIHSAARGPRPC